MAQKLSEDKLREIIRAEMKNVGAEEEAERAEESRAKAKEANKDLSEAEVAQKAHNMVQARAQHGGGGDADQTRAAAKFLGYAFGAIDKGLKPSLDNIAKVAAEGGSVYNKTLPVDKGFSQAVTKIQEYSGTDADGGFLARPKYMDQFIAGLYENNAIMNSGPMIVNLRKGEELRMDKLSGSVTVEWAGETGDIDASEVQFDQPTLSEKKLKALVIATEDLIRKADRDVISIIEEDLVSSVREKMEDGLLNGSGTGTPSQVAGLRTLVDAAHEDEISKAGSTSSVQEKISDLLDMKAKLAAEKIPFNRRGYIMQWRTIYHLMGLRGTDSFLFRDEIAQGRLMGDSLEGTNAFPTNLDDSGDATGDETDIVYAEFSEVVVAQFGDVRAYEATQGQVNDETSTARNLLTEELRALLLVRGFDQQTRRGGKEIAVKIGVDWSVES